MSIQWQLDGAYPSKSGSKNPKYKGRCAFTFVPPALAPLVIKRTYEKDDGKYGEQVTIEIEPGPRVRVRSAAVLVSEKGEPYVRCELDLPWDFSVQVATAALEEIERRQSVKGGAA